MAMFGCVPPSLGNYELQVCMNATNSTNAIKGASFSMRDVDKLIDCLKPCTMFKIRVRPNDETEDPISDATISITFQELITISNDQYSFTWLNLVAEVGGYVGLFLGYSVFQFTDLMDLIIRRVNSRLLLK